MRSIRTFKAGIIAPLPPFSLSPAYFFPDLIAAIGRMNRPVKIARDGSSIGRGSQKIARSYNQKMERWMKKEEEPMSLEWKSEEKKRKKLSRRIKVRVLKRAGVYISARGAMLMRHVSGRQAIFFC